MRTNQELALDILKELTDAFPGLLDGETDVNGSDLVDFLNYRRQDLIVLTKVK